MIRILRNIVDSIAYLWIKGKSKPFNVGGVEFLEFYHRYNTTWKNERRFEIPMAKLHIKGSTLEVGNVLSHYVDIGHTVVDKYEVGDGVINEDILYYKDKNKYQSIISISTIEHTDSPILIIEKLKKMLIRGGTLFITVPYGYNPVLDNYLMNSVFTESYWIRVGNGAGYDFKHMRANLLFIGVYQHGS